MLRILVTVAAVVVAGYAPGARAQICTPFSDVAATSGFCTNIQWLHNRGITQGCAATTYCPANFVRRDQLAAFLNRLSDHLFPVNCAAGQLMKWNGNAWNCAADNPGVTSVTAGTGLTGGTITTTGTVAADTTYLQRRVSGSCSAGSSIRTINTDGSVVCESDDSGAANAFVQGGNPFNTTAVLGTTSNQALEIVVNGERVMRYEPGGFGPNMVGGHAANSVAPNEFASTITGGGTAQSPNLAAGSFATIGGGANNVAGFAATVGGGTGNTASAQQSAIAGGNNNNATGLWSVVGGGNGNTASGARSTVGGGSRNAASGDYSTVAGGNNNDAPGYYSFAAGLGARANYAGCFVYSDASNVVNPTSCFGQNEIVIRGLGGFYFWTHGTSDATYFGARLAPGTGAWATYSDRSSKELIDPVDTSGVLEKLVAIPISTWQWKSEPGGIRHMGPMAQDFRRAFGLGDSDKQIVTVDADGVALAAIQGLNAKVERQGAEIAALKAELAALRRHIETPSVVVQRGQ